MDKKLILQTKCKANDCLYTLSDTFNLVCDNDTKILHIKNRVPLGITLEGSKIIGMCSKRWIQGYRVGWVLTQIGNINLESLDQSSTDMTSISSSILNLIYDTFNGSVVLVFSTFGESKECLDKTSEELRQVSLNIDNHQETILKTVSNTKHMTWRSGWGKRPPKMRLPR